jgi:hypothetical protein
MRIWTEEKAPVAYVGRSALLGFIWVCRTSEGRRKKKKKLRFFGVPSASGTDLLSPEYMSDVLPLWFISLAVWLRESYVVGE